jgi:UDP-glucose 4-epimerase
MRPEQKNLRILVTGGAGFIGSHIADSCLKKGWRVAVIDDLSTGFRKNVPARAAFYNVDIRDRENVRAVLAREKPDIIDHHAALASVVLSVKDPLSTFAVNVMGTMTVMTEGARAGVKKFIFASTGGAMYNEAKRIPVKEETPSPLSPYGFSKYMAEEAVRFLAREKNIRFTILRYANVYGSRQNPHGEAGVFAIFSALMKKGTRPVIFGNGSKTRDYVYVDDVVDANIKALTKGDGMTMNIGTGRETSDRQVFDALAKFLEFKKEPRFEPARRGEVLRSALDASLAKKVLGWEPKFTVTQGVRDMIDH